MSQNSDFPNIGEFIFIGDGNICLVKRDFSELFMKGKTGVLVLRPVEWLTNDQFVEKYPDMEDEVKCLDPNINVQFPPTS